MIFFLFIDYLSDLQGRGGKADCKMVTWTFLRDRALKGHVSTCVFQWMPLQYVYALTGKTIGHFFNVTLLPLFYSFLTCFLYHVSCAPLRIYLCKLQEQQSLRRNPRQTMHLGEDISTTASESFLFVLVEQPIILYKSKD